MVFGHYSIPMKRLTPQEVPAALRFEKGATFKLIVRVAHVMFIPIFPFEKTWVMDKGGDSYKLTPEANTLLNSMYGKRMPFYAFAGPLAIVGFFLFGFISDQIASTDYYKAKRAEKREMEMAAMAARKEAREAEQVAQQEARVLSYIRAPKTNDYYNITIGGEPELMKVESASADSIRFLVSIDNRQSIWKSNTQRASHFVNPNNERYSEQIAKKDVKAAFEAKEQGISLPGLFGGNTLVIEEVNQVDLSRVNIRYNDPAMEKEVKEAFLHFQKHHNALDSALALISEDSKKLFLDLHSQSAFDNFAEEQHFLQQTWKGDPALFKYYLYTKFVYRKTTEKSGSKEVDTIKDLGFFLKLLEQGLWGLGLDGTSTISKVQVIGVALKQPDWAQLNLKAPSNILTMETNISFTVDMKKEGGVWKISIPSTLSYTSQQVQKGGGARAFRSMVVDEMNKDLELDEKIPEKWKF